MLQKVRRVYRSLRDQGPVLPNPALSGVEPRLDIEPVQDLEPLFAHIQNVWEGLGETEPHWSVVTHDKYKSARIGGTHETFYQSGQEAAEILFRTLERNGISSDDLETCLEYGCGVGRVTAWLAERFTHVDAYDISRPHLREAEAHLSRRGIGNVALHHLARPHDLASFARTDLAYSIMVLQHNPPPIIRVIVQHLLAALNPRGVAYFQVPTYRCGYRFSPEAYLAGEARRDSIEMHVLPQAQIFQAIREAGCSVLEVLEDSWTGPTAGECSNTFLVQKG